jgi:hypothetical protein
MSNEYDQLFWDFLPENPKGSMAEIDLELRLMATDPLRLNKRLRCDDMLTPDEESPSKTLLEKFALNPEHGDWFAPEEKGWLEKLFAKNRERLRSKK